MTDADRGMLQAIRDYCATQRLAGEPDGQIPEKHARQTAYAGVVAESVQNPTLRSSMACRVVYRLSW